ncbi:SDR family oxidoreductase [Lactobacillus gigeriorum]|uniref:NAD-dependent epimerase dehydratase n=1 Tax=Lactobacillus gigeriorum DSM 23908 = CRBIP 24.85 TaxID=1423751 RepID=I7J1V3_9LACO|nr:SDR family oxidoreductase [Lactobacillus gigeriorum]KRN13873.1 NAD-dependent epimerase dehydratase [Lactobacillus gigeriorum DSM 23908 = CRBIP 24.85]CCI86487.1 Oxidoreductase [Lactobacillus gigeriorum DSM 23908 = CRBIP 24.85]
MKVFVAGATGRVGQEVVKLLLQANHQVVAGARHVDRLDDATNLQKVTLDLHDSVADLTKLLLGCDAVIFTGGSRGKDLLQTDLNGAVKLMMAAEQVGSKRFVHLSSAFALDQEKWATIPSLASLTDYNIAKFFSDKWLMDETHLDYTIVQPGSLTEEPATGKIALNVKDGGTNPIPDVAHILVACLDHPNTIGQVLIMHSGDTEIDAALNKVK